MGIVGIKTQQRQEDKVCGIEAAHKQCIIGTKSSK